MKLSMNRKLLYKIIAGFLLLVITVAVYMIRQGGESDIYWLEPEETGNTAEEVSFEAEYEPEQEEEITIVIDLSGEVMNPSVYVLPEGSRVYEAIDAAGGLTQQADIRNTNLAAPLSDGMKLHIPDKQYVAEEQKKSGEAPGSRYVNGSSALNAETSTSSEADSKNTLININTAGSAELQKLSGVGPSTAEKIIDYRKEYGRFNRIEELMNVSGIGEKTFAKLKNRIITE